MCLQSLQLKWSTKQNMELLFTGQNPFLTSQWVFKKKTQNLFSVFFFFFFSLTWLDFPCSGRIASSLFQRQHFKWGKPSSNTQCSPPEHPLWGCFNARSVRKKLNTPYTMITSCWHPFDSWNSWQLFFFLLTNFCWQEEEAEGKAAMFAGASGSSVLLRLCWVPGSTLGGFFLPPISHSSLKWILLPCWKTWIVIQRISLASHIPAIIIQMGRCWEGVVAYLGMERGGKCIFGLVAPLN